MAKMLEILRVQPSEALGVTEPSCRIDQVRLLGPSGPIRNLPFRMEGETITTLVVPLEQDVWPGESVTVELDITFEIPQKQGRWGQWAGVTYLSNWLPVFAFYGMNQPWPAYAGPGLSEPKPGEGTVMWQPTPFVPWHQPFFNEAGIYHVRAKLPCDQKVACTGSIVGQTLLGDGRQEVAIQAIGVRDFAFLCSARYQVVEGQSKGGPGDPPVKIRVLAFPEHQYYAQEMLKIAGEALDAYGRWFGPYPWPEYTVVEAFFGWNGNECSTLVMIDERVFGMPQLARGYVDYLLSHETCHQWFYNLVGTQGYSETWMDEGLANYFSHRLLNIKVGRNNPLMQYPRGLEWLPNIHRESYRSYGMYGTFARNENGPVIRDMKDFAHLIDLFNQCYDKGGRIVGMIEERLGQTAFIDFMRIIVRKYRYRILRVEDFRCELELYTGKSWEEFFRHWLYGSGLSDWALDKLEVVESSNEGRKSCGLLARLGCLPESSQTAGPYKVTVWLTQNADYDEPTSLGFAFSGQKGYPVRVPILPDAEAYQTHDPPASIQIFKENGHTRVRVDVDLPGRPFQATVDPDQVLVDRNPTNNFWRPPVRVRVTPLYTFLEETDLTTAWDRWNLTLGPWVYGSPADDAWYTRSSMIGVRAGGYRTQFFSGGVYAAYRPDYKDMVAGVDGVVEHWPGPKFQSGFNYEQRIAEYEDGNSSAKRGVLWSRYIFTYGSSLYLPPIHYVEGFAAYQDNFLPFTDQPSPQGVRYDRLSSAGAHYRINYLTPYWDPEGGFQFDAWAEGGTADAPVQVGFGKASSQFVFVKGLPDLSHWLDGNPKAQAAAGPFLEWLGETRLAFRLYGATSLPTNGEFFSMGGGQLFRGFDLAERQGSAVWVGSLEWRVPILKDLRWDCCDHVLGLRNVYGAAFYDVGDAYVSNRSVGPVAHAVGAGLRLDLAWFSFVERSVLRFDVAKTVNVDTPVQFWFGIMQPF
jgi:hypothetical protein